MSGGQPGLGVAETVEHGASVPSIALVGVHGHGASHVATALALREAGRIAFDAVVDPRPIAATEAGADVPWFASVDALIGEGERRGRPFDVVVLCTPIHTHGPLAEQLMRAGSDVLLEKPPTATFAEFATLEGVEAETGRSCQVAFQSLGSAALPAIHALVADGAIGEVTHVGGVGTWVRATSYWTRSGWAGRRVLDGRPVVDGVVTNPLAHAVATALQLAGAVRADDVATVEVELFRANDIEADDTSSVVVTTTTGLRVALGLTLSATETTPPVVTVYGTAGRIDLLYTQDVVTIERYASGAGSGTGTGTGTGAGAGADARAHEPSTETRVFGRTNLLENLVEHHSTGEPLLVGLADTGAFMTVLEAVRVAPPPRAIDDDLLTWHDDERGVHPVVTDVEKYCRAVSEGGVGFAAAGAPWAVRS